MCTNGLEDKGELVKETSKNETVHAIIDFTAM